MEDFVTYLERKKPHFYDGTKSTLCHFVLSGGFDGAVCSWFNGPGLSVQQKFERDNKLYALTWTPKDPLHAFLNPAFIGLQAEGKNLGNEALIFHEALHGLKGWYDDALLKAFGLSSPSCTIEMMIRRDVLAHAPNLNPQVMFNCP